MTSSAMRRLAFTTTASLALAASVAGCGSKKADSSTTSSSSSSTDGASLLRASFLKVSPNGAPIKSGTVGISIKGSGNFPKDTQLKSLSGEADLSVSVDKGTAGNPLPPFALTFAAKGSYEDGSGTKGSGDYKGGISYIGNSFFANWEGKDYAVGDELSKQAIEALKQEEAKAGVQGSTPLAGQDPQKILNAMDLDPGTWIKSPAVTDGGTLDGVDTQKISGDVDIKAAADDIVQGLKNLPAQFPTLPGVDQLKSISSISSTDLADAEKQITTFNAAVWVGKDDHLQRKLEVHIAGGEGSGNNPGKIDLTIDITTSKLNQSQGLTAPKTSAPITDLILQLQQQFSNGPLKNVFS